MDDLREQCTELLAEIPDYALPGVMQFLQDQLDNETMRIAYEARARNLYPEQSAAIERARRNGTLAEYRKADNAEYM